MWLVSVKVEERTGRLGDELEWPLSGVAEKEPTQSLLKSQNPCCHSTPPRPHRRPHRPLTRRQRLPAQSCHPPQRWSTWIDRASSNSKGSIGQLEFLQQKQTGKDPLPGGQGKDNLYGAKGGNGPPGEKWALTGY